MNMLQISEKLKIPLEIVTQTTAVLGKRGSGKTYTGSVFAEEMLGAGLQVIIIDPLDVWHGLRSTADGKSGAFDIILFGGPNGVLPLEAADGVRAGASEKPREDFQNPYVGPSTKARAAPMKAGLP